jgi:hypothetical protein
MEGTVVGDISPVQMEGSLRISQRRTHKSSLRVIASLVIDPSKASSPLFSPPASKTL